MDLQQAWANEAYDAFRRSDRDVPEMARHLADVEREDGSRGFSEAEIHDVKRHVFDRVHRFAVIGPDGEPVPNSYTFGRFRPDADMAEAWIRLGSGRALPEDVMLLEHELREARVEADAGVGPDGIPHLPYGQAHAEANKDFPWEKHVPDRTGEDLDGWRGRYGDPAVVRDGGPERSPGDVSVRLPGEGPRPDLPSGGRDVRGGGRSGGSRDEGGDQGHSPASPGGERLAERGRGPALDESPEAAGRSVHGAEGRGAEDRTPAAAGDGPRAGDLDHRPAEPDPSRPGDGVGQHDLTALPEDHASTHPAHGVGEIPPLRPLDDVLAFTGHEWSGEGLHLTAEQTAAMHVPYALAHGAADRIAQHLSGLVEGRPGTDLAGLEHRLKTPDSLCRKVAHDYAEAVAQRERETGGPLTAPQAEALFAAVVDSTRDVVRFTVRVDPRHYEQTTRSIMDALSDQGFRLSRLKNAWQGEPDTYKGINTIWRDSQGVWFELQFHTEASLHAKTVEHPIYERLRVDADLTPQQRVALESQRRAVYLAVPEPPGARDIPVYPPPATGRPPQSGGHGPEPGAPSRGPEPAAGPRPGDGGGQPAGLTPSAGHERGPSAPASGARSSIWEALVPRTEPAPTPHEPAPEIARDVTSDADQRTTPADDAVASSPRAAEDGERGAAALDRWEIAEFPINRDLGPEQLRPTNEIDTPQRQQRRQRIVDEALRDALPVSGREPVLYLMGGGGASGKGFVGEMLVARGEIPADGVVRLDPDKLKERIPEYGQIIEAGDSRAAAVVHEESSDLAKRILAGALERKLDLVYDVTLGNPAKGLDLIERAKAAGYEVRLYGVSADAAVAVSRNSSRAAQTGRYVPIEMQLEAHRGFSEGFRAYADRVDAALLFDTNGPRPELIAGKVPGGELVVRDPEKFAAFERKAQLDPHAQGPSSLFPAREPADPGAARDHLDADAPERARADDARSLDRGENPEPKPAGPAVPAVSDEALTALKDLKPLPALDEATAKVGQDWRDEYGQSLTAAQTEPIGAHYRSMRAHSDQLTLHVLEVTRELPGTKVEGTDHRLKTVESLFDKVSRVVTELRDKERWPEEREKQVLATERIVRGLRDVARYTIVTDDARYAATVPEVVERLKARGLVLVEVKNSWADDSRPYQGLNTTWWDRNLEAYLEVQVHTPDSLEAKEREHGLYDQRRVGGQSPADLARLNQLSRDIFGAVPVPEGIRQVPSFRNADFVPGGSGPRSGGAPSAFEAARPPDSRPPDLRPPDSRAPEGRTAGEAPAPGHGADAAHDRGPVPEPARDPLYDRGPDAGQPPGGDPAPTPDAPIVHRPTSEPTLPIADELSGDVRFGRPLDARQQPLPLFDGEPTRSQVQQGNLGDCGVVATIGAVAGHHPELISGMITQAPDGRVHVTIHEVQEGPGGDRYVPTGRAVRLELTPDVPVAKTSPDRSTYMNQNEVGSSWASMLEKAAATVDGTWTPQRHALNAIQAQSMKGYGRLDAGSSAWSRAELLAQLTGRPAVVETFDTAVGHEAAVEAHLRDLLDDGRPVLVGVPQPADGGRPPFGLYGGHAYEVVRVEDGKVFLRNPWNTADPAPIPVRDFLDVVRPQYTTLDVAPDPGAIARPQPQTPGTDRVTPSRFAELDHAAPDHTALDRTALDHAAPRPPSREQYVDRALENLSRTSRTASGVVDVSASPDKAAHLAPALTGERAAQLAQDNVRATVEHLYGYREERFTSPQELRAFVEDAARRVNDGIVRDGTLYREHDSQQYPYTKVRDLPRAVEEFYVELHERLSDPAADPVETAAWIEYRMDLTDHFWADGCGKTSKVLAAYALMRCGHDLPHYPADRAEQFAAAPTRPRDAGPDVDRLQFDRWRDQYRTWTEGASRDVSSVGGTGRTITADRDVEHSAENSTEPGSSVSGDRLAGVSAQVQEQFERLRPLAPLEEVLAGAGKEWRGANGLRLSGRDTATIGEHYRRLHEASDELTLLVMDAAGEVPGATVEGLEHRLKAVDSLNRKVADRLQQERSDGSWPVDPRQQRGALRKLLHETNDISRYTVVCEAGRYVETVADLVQGLRARGFEQIDLKNSWNDLRRDYQGVNSTWWDSSHGVTFEVQVHTADSLSAKTREHVFYEERRLPGVSEPQKARLAAVSKEIFGAVPIPDGVRTIPDYKNPNPPMARAGDDLGALRDTGPPARPSDRAEGPGPERPAAPSGADAGQDHNPAPASPDPSNAGSSQSPAAHPVVDVVVPEPTLPAQGARRVSYGRPRDPSGAHFPLFVGDPVRTQVAQGGLGDCGIVAVIGAVAGHHPETVRDLIESRPDGSIVVTVHEAVADPSGDRYVPTGKRVRLHLSPDVPVDATGARASYMQQNEVGVAWPALLEKAAAGIDQSWDSQREATNTLLKNGRKGYDRLASGTNAWTRAELLAQFTGRTAVVRDFDLTAGHEAAVEKQLKADLAAGKPILVGVPKPKQGTDLPFDLVGGHAYEVVDVVDGDVVLRNPWNERHPEPMEVREFLDVVRPQYTTLE